MVMNELRKRLGARLLVGRVQGLKWNLSRASTAAAVDDKVIKRIEAGENYEIESLERYAVALGRPLEAWLREVVIGEEIQPSAAALPATGKRFREDWDGRERRAGTDRRQTTAQDSPFPKKEVR